MVSPRWWYKLTATNLGLPSLTLYLVWCLEALTGPSLGGGSSLPLLVLVAACDLPDRGSWGWNASDVACAPPGVGIQELQAAVACPPALAERRPYDLMYGVFVQRPLWKKLEATVLEVGAGCDLERERGGSVRFWRHFFPAARLWEAGSDDECFARCARKGLLDNVNTLVGDQGDPQVLASWPRESGEAFDVVVDRGRTYSQCKLSTFEGLWPHVAPGGLFFMQGLDVCWAQRNQSIADVVGDWYEQLMIPGGQRPHALPAEVAFVLCQVQGCVVGKKAAQAGTPAMCGAASPGIWEFEEAAKALKPTAGRVTLHSYQLMYGLFLQPLRLAKAPFKMLEISLNCQVAGAVDVSVRLWRALFPRFELWEANNDVGCVSKMRIAWPDVHMVTGDQADAGAVAQWVNESGGGFDAVIDDGGHKSKEIRVAFDGLWPQLKPGGVYFIEALQVSRNPAYNQKGVASMADVIGDWVAQLVSATPGPRRRAVHALPPDMGFAFCQAEGCVFGKRPQQRGAPRVGSAVGR